MRKVFICYRRAAAQYAAGSLGRELRGRFGEEQVFRDREDMEGGASWREQILRAISSQAALLVLIDRDWAEPSPAFGRRRLDDPNDPIRMEIRDGLADGATVIPVLLESARMPDETDLPEDIRRLAEIHAFHLRDSDWPHDLERICGRLERAGFAPVAGAAAAPAAPAGRTKPGVYVKLIASYALAMFAGLALLGDESHEISGGIAFIATVALLPAVFAYQDHRKGRSQQLWPTLGALVLSGLVVLGGLIGMGKQHAPGAAPPSLSNAAATANPR